VGTAIGVPNADTTSLLSFRVTVALEKKIVHTSTINNRC
jgi:hypothetical protein